MQVYMPEELITSDGRMCMAYGETNVGKSVTTLLTAPDPIFLIWCENRGLAPTLKAVYAQRPDLRLYTVQYTTFFETMDFLNRGHIISPTTWAKLMESKTILVDSVSDLMAIKLSLEIQDETFDARSDDEKKKKQLISQSKLTQEGYGGVAAQTIRFTNTIARFARMEGKYVILLARQDERPSWGFNYQYAPLLKGKEYGKDFKGMFDLIGRVVQRPRYGDQGLIGNDYPPGVTFGPDDGSFCCKYTGLGEDRRFLMDWTRIFNYSLTGE
jgi:hypothetical protein